MQGAANKMLLVDAGSMKDLISQQMKNIKHKTARLMQLLQHIMQQRHDWNQSNSQECTTVDSCFGLLSPHQYSIVPQREDCPANASQLLQSLCVLCSFSTQLHQPCSLTPSICKEIKLFNSLRLSKTCKFVSTLPKSTVRFLAAVNHRSGPLRKHQFTCDWQVKIHFVCFYSFEVPL